MSRIRVYVNPFDTNGDYTTYQEVTDDVDSTSLGILKRSIDSTEYDVGVIKINSIQIRLSNETGKYSDVDSLRSIFSYKRSDSLVKLVWDPNDYDQQSGPLHAGQGILTNADAVTVFEGMLNDEGTVQDINDQKISFQCFGMEYLLNRITTPYAEITNGDTMEELLYRILNQAPFSDLVTVNAENITVGSNVAIDDKSDLENTVVYEILQDLLLASNAVLYIEDSVLYISPREPSLENKYTFYGEASNTGTENIEKVQNYRNGLHRVFNYWTWDETNILAEDDTSTDLFGVRKKSLNLAIVTDVVSIQTCLDNLRDEFSPRKQELNITTKVNDARLALRILDKVNIDYPTIVYSADGEEVPIYGVAKHGQFKYPLDEYAFTISSLDPFKIIAIDYNFKTERINFKLRAI